MTRAPVKLSREMKLLLLLLLMVGLIGLWYVLTNKPSTGDLAQQPTPPTTAGSGSTAGTPATGSAGGTGSAGSTGAAGGGSTGGTVAGTPDVGNPDAVPVTPPAPADAGTGAASGLTVQPDSQVQVETIPPFPTEGTVAATPAPEPAVPSGINPDGVVTAAPGSNPFRPLNLDATAGAAGDGGTASAAPTTPAPAPSTSSSTGVTAAIPAQPVPAPVDPLGTSGGALGLSPIPGSDAATDVTAGSSSGGALPVPVIPGGDGSAGVPATSVVVPVTPAGDAATPGTPGTAGSVVLTPPAPAPVRPPVVGVNVPGTARGLPSVVAAAPTAAADEAPGTASAAASTATALPTPGTPQVIRDLQTGAAGTGSAASALDRYVQDQALVFNAVVLGPVNTAIFRSRAGYVVVASGQPLPDSKVVVENVTASSATLNLGTDSKTLELDKR